MRRPWIWLVSPRLRIKGRPNGRTKACTGAAIRSWEMDGLIVAAPLPSSFGEAGVIPSTFVAEVSMTAISSNRMSSVTENGPRLRFACDRYSRC